MSASSDLQAAIQDILSTPVLAGGVLVSPLRVPVHIVKRRPKEIKNDIEAAAAAQAGLCIYVMPPLPTSALQNQPFVFFDKAEVKVRIVERIALNATGADAYDLIDDVATALHWRSIPTILAHPLELCPRPCAIVESTTLRMIDVLFNAVYGLHPQ